MNENSITKNIPYLTHYDTMQDYIKAENKVWYGANKYDLINFYKINRYQSAGDTVGSTGTTWDFYRVINANSTYKLPIQHFPISDMITKTMVNLVFAEKPEITIDTGNKRQDKKINDLISYIYDKNKFNIMLQNSAEMKSYSGAVGFKLILDPDFSNTPIIVAYPDEDIILTYKYGRIIEIGFKDSYKLDEDTYICVSSYGMGEIYYTLYKNKVCQDNIVPIDTIPETAGLENIIIYDADGITRSKQLMAVYIPNKTKSISDYSGCVDDFQAIDEIYSNMINYIRKSKVKTYFPENLCYKDEKGNAIIPNDYDTDNTILYDTNPTDLKQEAKRDVIDIQNTITGYITSFNEVLTNCLRTTGLSSASLGFDDGGANSSGEALSIREKVSMRTRSAMIHIWDEGLSELTKLILEYNECVPIYGGLIFPNYNDAKINVAFAEYESPTFDGLVTSLGAALNNKLIDQETALKQLWGKDLTEEQLADMNAKINNVTVEKEEQPEDISTDDDDDDDDDSNGEE